MLKKLFESFTTVTGSKRTDVLAEARNISRRSTIAFHLSHDDAFVPLISQAEQICGISEDPNFDQASIFVDKVKVLRKDLLYLETVQGLSERISNAYRAGNADSKRQMQGNSDTECRELVRLVLVAGDCEHKLWSESEVVAARSRFGLKRVPSFDELNRLYGVEEIERASKDLLQERITWLKFQNELQGSDSPCHACGATTDLTYHDFALARLLEKDRDWKPSGAAIAISALTLPTLGVGYLRGPSSTQTANILRMRLVLCNSCSTTRKKGAGFAAAENDCAIHPWWHKAHEVGFDKFVPSSEIKGWL